MTSGLLTQRATIQRAATGPGDGPEPKETWATLTSGVPCRVQMRGGSEQGPKPFEATAETYVIFFGYGADVTARDRVVIGSRTYELDAVDADVAGAGHHVEANARRVD